MNIVCRKTSHLDADPFSASDRNLTGSTGAGKGDAARSVGNRFKNNFDAINWGPKKSKPGKTRYRYPR